MSTKEILLQRPDIPDASVQELVERAAELQDLAHTETVHATANDVVRVAEELDIESQFVEQAISEWRTNQAGEASAAVKSRIKKRGRTMMRWILVGLVVTIAIGAALTFASVSIFGWKGLVGLGTASAAIVAFLSWLLG